MKKTHKPRAPKPVKSDKADKKPGFFGELIEQIKRDKAAFIVFAILRVIVIAVLVRAAVHGQWESVFVCVLTLVLFLLPQFVEKQLSITLPTALEITVFGLVFCAEILGELGCYYLKFPFWDTALHTTSGFIFAAVGFCMLDLLNRNKKINLTPITLALVAFCFSMTIGVLWEFFEFSADTFFKTDMQKDTVVSALYSTALDPLKLNKAVPVTDIVRTTIECADGSVYTIDGYLDLGIIDTMKDLLVNFVGAVVFSTIGFFYVRHRGRTKTKAIVEGFVPKVNKPKSNKQNNS